MLANITEVTRRPTRVQQFHDGYSHSSTSTCEDFLQDIIIENIPIEEEESSHPTRRSMSISRSIQADIVLADPFLVATNESYFIKSAGIQYGGGCGNLTLVCGGVQGGRGARRVQEGGS